MKKSMIFRGLAVAAAVVVLGSCEKFMDGPVPQGTVSEADVLSPKHVEDLCIAAYAGYSTFEEINTSFTLWNFDVRSDDAYKGGNGTEDGDVFHALEVCKGVLPTMWNVNDMWRRLYMAVGRPNAALSVLEKMDESDFPMLQGCQGNEEQEAPFVGNLKRPLCQAKGHEPQEDEHGAAEGWIVEELGQVGSCP